MQLRLLTRKRNIKSPDLLLFGCCCSVVVVVVVVIVGGDSGGGWRFIDYCIEVIVFMQRTWTEISEETFSRKSSLRRYTEFIIQLVDEWMIVPSTKVFPTSGQSKIPDDTCANAKLIAVSIQCSKAQKLYAYVTCNRWLLSQLEVESC